jgi:hypothetical protein
MAQYSASIQVGNGGLNATVQLDGQPIADRQSCNIASGDHVLQWLLYGPAGATVVITLTPTAGGSPVSTSDAVPPNAGFEAGFYKFKA